MIGRAPFPKPSSLTERSTHTTGNVMISAVMGTDHLVMPCYGIPASLNRAGSDNYSSQPLFELP